MLFKILFGLAISIFLFIITIVGFQTHLGLAIKYLIAAVPFADKVVHFSMTVTLSLLLCFSTNQRQVNLFGRWMLFSSLALAIGFTLEEFSQAFIPSRNFEIMDMLCNYAGIYMGSRLGCLLKPKHLTDDDHFRRQAFSIQTIRHSAGPLLDESGHGRRAARRLVRHHGRR
jgi:hypothetical protein